MKKLLISLIVAFISIQLAYSQSLADIAKKEKERREKIKQQGKTTRVVTNEDIEKMSDKRTGIEPSTADLTSESEETTSESTTTQEKEAEAVEKSSTEETKPEEKIAEQIDKQINQLKARLEELKKKRNEEEDRINRGAGIFTFNPGEAYQKIREYDQQIKDIEIQIQQLETQKLGV